jgi:N-acetylneuraminic acid mutarotase
MSRYQKIIVIVFFTLYLFAYCKKNGSEILVGINSFSPGTDGPGAKVTIKGFGFGYVANEVQLTFNETNAVIKSISDTLLIAEVPANATTGKITIRNVKGKATSQTDFIILKGQWKKMAELPGPGRFVAVSFVIGNKGYAGTGFSNQGKLKDFYVYDPAGNSWTQIADMPAQVRSEAVGFSILNKGYVITGSDNSQNLKEVWEYDPIANAWTRKADFPGTKRYGAAGFSIGTKGYMGTGFTDISSGQQQQLKDWWEYDPVTDTWTQKNDFPGGTRNLATALSTGNAGYMGLGAAGGAPLNDWWQYQPATDTWSRKKDYPGSKRYCAGGFFAGNKCYVGNGGDGLAFDPDKTFSDWWEYDITADTWTQKTSQIEDRYCGCGITINSISYFGFGYNNNIGHLKDFWEFRPI